MPFLLCFSYRLYYQYIFIYFSASSSDKENSSIIFLITSSVNNSPFFLSFPADVADAGFQTAKQCRFHRTYRFHTLKKHRKTNCCANNNNNCNDDPGWKLQICRKNPRPGQVKKVHFHQSTFPIL